MIEASNKIYAVIMAGGRGERFWPVSRNSSPKQFVSLFGGKPLIRMAVERLEGLVDVEDILVVTSADLVERSREALPMLPEGNIIGEPFGRDTAAACALGTAWASWKGGDSATVVVLTADHLMKNAEVFRRTIRDSVDVAREKSAIGVIGIIPQFPATGFGYIEADTKLETGKETSFVNVSCFVEKPNLEVAKKYVASGKHYWNSGMFIWNVKTFQAAIEEHCPKVASMMQEVTPHFGKPEFNDVLLAEYNKLDKISIDYAVMEKVNNIIAAEGDFGWDDVGTWISAGDHFDEDESNNRVYGNSVLLDSEKNIVVNCDKEHLIAVLGAEDIIVVHTKDATLVCKKAAASNMKELVKKVSSVNDKQYT